MEEQLGIRLPGSPPAFGEVRSMRGIPHALRGAAGALPQDPPGDSRRHPPRPEKRPEVAYALLNAHDLLRDA